MSDKLPYKVLIVEDDIPSKLFVRTVLASRVEKVISAQDGAEGLELFNAEKPDIIISDIAMPVMNGIEFAKKIREIDPDIQILFTTAFDTKDFLIDAINLGVNQYIVKPLQKEQILAAFSRAASIVGLQRELEESRKSLIEAYNALEDRVIERTLELRESAAKLEEEIEMRREAEIKLLAAKEFAEEANRSKTNFLAKVSHELRTPMNGIIGMVSILLDGELTEKQARSLRIVKQSADTLLLLINDLLDFSRMDTGKFRLIPERFVLSDAIRKAVDVVMPIMQSKGIYLETNMPPNLPVNLIGDGGRLQQVLINLLGNAAKFTERGGVGLEVKATEYLNNSVKLEFAVRDTGIGIPPDKLINIFNGFEQIESSHLTRKYGGTGLGLAICREIVEMMRGEIRAESELGLGSIFRFTAVFGFSSGKSNGEASVPEAESYDNVCFNLRILIVEDSEINVAVMREMLIPWGCELTIVAGGEDALKLLETESYDIVFMDVQGPGIDGCEATRRIRAIDRLAALPVIGITAYADQTHETLCMEAGMNASMTKPVDKSMLHSALLKYGNGMHHARIDLANLMKSINYNFGLLGRLSDYYLKNYQANIDSVKDSFEKENYKAYYRALHKIKSELGTLGAEHGVSLIRALESHSAAPDKEKTRDLHEKFLIELQYVSDYFRTKVKKLINEHIGERL